MEVLVVILYVKKKWLSDERESAEVGCGVLLGRGGLRVEILLCAFRASNFNNCWGRPPSHLVDQGIPPPR